jgi:hypothetical protein
MTASTICVHCALLPKRVDSHSVVALCDTDGTPDRAWFFTNLIYYVQLGRSVPLMPGNCFVEDWEYQRLHNGTELMVLKANSTQYIWKLTHRYDHDSRFGVWVD